VPSAAEQARDLGRVDGRRPAAGDRENPVVHLDEQGEGLAVGQVDDLVRKVRDAVDVARPGDGAEEHLDAGQLVRLEHAEQGREELALLLGQRRVEELGEQLLARAVAQAPGQGLRIALGRRRVRERARVLVDPEREGGRLEGRHRELTLREHADEGGRECAVLGKHGVLRGGPVRGLARVVVEDDRLDGRVDRDRLELAQPGGMSGLDDD
jgi:hypothetical protein